MSLRSLQDRALGRWASILPRLLPREVCDQPFLKKKNRPCPLCGGTDRFQWTDYQQHGTYFCRQCGPGSGISLVMKVRGLNFAQAAKLIEAELPSAVPVFPKAAAGNPSDKARATWAKCHKLDGREPASAWLGRRGLDRIKWPSQLRFLPNAKYWPDDRKAQPTTHPAMVAQFVSADTTETTVHTTYLDDTGDKARVEKVRKLAPGPVPPGGAVRLAPSATVMGIAEGIETALAAMQLFQMPVWAGLNTTGLTKWQPPPTAKCIFIFGDNDRHFAGQHKAHSLAAKLSTEGYHVEMRIPPRAGTDWNDVLLEARA